MFFHDLSGFKQGKQNMPKTLCMLSKNWFLQKNFWVDKGTKNDITFKKFCTEKDIEVKQ